MSDLDQVHRQKQCKELLEKNEAKKTVLDMMNAAAVNIPQSQYSVTDSASQFELVQTQPAKEPQSSSPFPLFSLTTLHTSSMQEDQYLDDGRTHIPLLHC